MKDAYQVCCAALTGSLVGRRGPLGTRWLLFRLAASATRAQFKMRSWRCERKKLADGKMMDFRQFENRAVTQVPTSSSLQRLVNLVIDTARLRELFLRQSGLLAENAKTFGYKTSLGRTIYHCAKVALSLEQEHYLI
jgi:hypothetical protein